MQYRSENQSGRGNGKKYGGYNAYKPGSGPNKNGRGQGGHGNGNHYSGNGGYRGSNNQSGNGGNQYRNGENRGHAGNKGPVPFAPYNFAKLWETPLEDSRPMTARNSADEGLLSGEISYDMTAQTPIFISAGKQRGQETGQFYRDAYGNFALPGSSVRGLIRSNVTVLSLSSLAGDVEDQLFMYRNVANGLDKKHYNDVLGNKPIPLGKDRDGNPIQMSVLTNVMAGYIAKEGNGYVIRPCRKVNFGSQFGKMNYYVISERVTANEYATAQERHQQSAFDYLYPENGNKSRVQYMPKRFRLDMSGRVPQYKGTANRLFIPHYEPVTYDTDNGRKITAIGGKGRYPHKGMLLVSGFMQNKKAIYIIPEKDPNGAGDTITIPKDDIETFRVDYNRRERTLTFDKKSPYREDKKICEEKTSELKQFFNLPIDGEEKPVFFVELQGHIYFGFTPRLREYYDQSVASTLLKTHHSGIHDYVTGIFGCADNGGLGSWKSKVSFSDAVVAYPPAKELGKRILVLGEPRATDYLNYLQADEKGRAVNYNRDFKIRGVKQYWLHHSENEGIKESSDITTNMNPLDKGTVFKGKIRFHNLYPDELGLLLWSLRLEENSVMNIGMAKPYGYGAVKVSDVQLRIWNNVKAYDLSLPDLTSAGAVEQFLQPYDEKNESDQKKYIRNYQDTVSGILKKKYRIERITDVQAVKDLLLMKDAEKIPDASVMNYMELQSRDDHIATFRSATKYGSVLPAPSAIAAKEKN